MCTKGLTIPVGVVRDRWSGLLDSWNKRIRSTPTHTHRSGCPCQDCRYRAWRGGVSAHSQVLCFRPLFFMVELERSAGCHVTTADVEDQAQCFVRTKRPTFKYLLRSANKQVALAKSSPLNDRLGCLVICKLHNTTRRWKTHNPIPGRSHIQSRSTQKEALQQNIGLDSKEDVHSLCIFGPILANGPSEFNQILNIETFTKPMWTKSHMGHGGTTVVRRENQTGITSASMEIYVSA